jgi:hypothetical protein
LVAGELNFDTVIFGNTATSLSKKTYRIITSQIKLNSVGQRKNIREVWKRFDTSQVDSNQGSTVTVSSRAMGENAVDRSFRVRHVTGITASVASRNDCPVGNIQVILSTRTYFGSSSGEIKSSVHGFKRQGFD